MAMDTLLVYAIGLLAVLYMARKAYNSWRGKGGCGCGSGGGDTGSGCGGGCGCGCSSNQEKTAK